MVTHAERAINKASAYANDFNVCMMVGAVVTNLLQAAQCRKVADGIGKNSFAGKRHTRSHAGHVLLCNASVCELVGYGLPEGLQYSKAKVTRDEFDVGILLSQFDKCAYKSVSHIVSEEKVVSGFWEYNHGSCGAWTPGNRDTR